MPAEAQTFFESLRLTGQTGSPATKASPPIKTDATQPTGKVPDGWVSFTPPSGNYSVAMPQQPTETALKLPTGETKIFAVTLPNAAMPLHTTANPLPPELAKLSAEDMLRQVALAVPLMSGGKVLEETKISVGKHQGRQFHLTVQAKGGPIEVFARVYLVNDHIIVLQGPATGSSPAQETAAFFNSLKIGG